MSSFIRGRPAEPCNLNDIQLSPPCLSGTSAEYSVNTMGKIQDENVRGQCASVGFSIVMEDSRLHAVTTAYGTANLCDPWTRRCPNRYRPISPYHPL